MDRLPLRELFASAAPEVPDWYQPPKIKDPLMPTPAPEIAEVAMEWVKNPLAFFAERFDQCFDPIRSVLPVDLRRAPKYWNKYRPAAEKFEHDMKEWWDMCSDTKKQNREDRYFSWRWYYADKMLEAMEKKS